MNEGRKTGAVDVDIGGDGGAVDFYIGGDIDIEMRLGNAVEDLQTRWYGMGCMGPLTKNMRWFLLLKEFNCTVTSTGRVTVTIVKTTLGEPGDLEFGRINLIISWAPVIYALRTWYLNKVRLRTWDHFPVVVKIEGRDLRAKKGAKGWAGWIPNSEVEKCRFQELVLCSGDGRVGTPKDEDGGLVALQERLEEAATGQGYHDGCAEQEPVHCPARGQGDGGRGGKMQRPGEEEVATEKSPSSPERVRGGWSSLTWR